MKICAACSQELPKEKFSKKQWQSRQQRRCKECIAANQEVQLEAPANNNDDAPLMSSADAELNRAWTDEDLFKEPPPRAECPICLLTLPLSVGEVTYQECCGKNICSGCFYADAAENNIRDICPFCRAPAPTSNGEYIERIKKRVEGGDASGMRSLGCKYLRGSFGLPQNIEKANELWLRAGGLGSPAAYGSVGNSYCTGRGMESDEQKAKYYYELAAMMGEVPARHNLGVLEKREGNVDRAVKHYMISAGAGLDKSLKAIRGAFLNGHATKDDFEKALRAHQASNDEMKSDQREAAKQLKG